LISEMLRLLLFIRADKVVTISYKLLALKTKTTKYYHWFVTIILVYDDDDDQ